MLAITGATGQLGRLVIDQLLETIPSGGVVALVRDLDKAADLAARGVELRHADYDQPGTLTPALKGVERLLMISGSEVGKREPQHRAVIDAALKAGVKFVAYTSILHAPNSTIVLAEEHRQTEKMLRESGLEFALLRNGWYFENHLASIGSAVEHGALLGSTQDGRISSATRADYAAAAVAVLLNKASSGHVYELAGDESMNLSELAAEIAHQSGKPVVHKDLPPADYQAVLEGVGLPTPVAKLYSQLDAGSAGGALRNDDREMRELIGRPTTTMADAVSAALARL